MKIAWAISGSFCNHTVIKKEISDFVSNGHDVTVILSKNSVTMDTRFGSADTFIKDLEKITNNKVMTTLLQAETLGPINTFDCMVIAPCTSTVLSKLAHGDYGHVCTLAAKATLRNEKPIIIAIASNDILGNSAHALFTLKQTKNIYIVPFYQDDSINKPNSCVSKWRLIAKTMDHALNYKQLQPILYVKESDYE